MTAFLPVYVTCLVLLDYLALAVLLPRIHFGLRFLVLVLQTAVFFAVGILAPDIYFAAFPPLDTLVGDLNAWMVGVLGFLVALPAAVVVWLVRTVRDRRSSGQSG